MGKAEITSEYILERVAPYFNMHGYHATSMNDITRITGLTKGAIYGNFKNKEALSFEAFRYNVRKVILKIAKVVNSKENAIDKLLAVTNFYRNYVEYTKSMGGCPIVRVGIDSLHNNQLLKDKVKSVSEKIKFSLIKIVEEGKQKSEIRKDVFSERFVNVMFSVIDGAVLNTNILGKQDLMKDCMDHMDEMILRLKA